MSQTAAGAQTIKSVRPGALSIRNLTKIYDPEGANVVAVDNCSMEIAGAEVCMIVGPSGCGKTTLLTAIAGFHSITFGEIWLDGTLLCGPGKPLADQGADRIVVFQNGALFPWKTLVENVAYGPIVQRHMARKQALAKARAMLGEAGLGSVADKFPGEVFIRHGAAGGDHASPHQRSQSIAARRAISRNGRADKIDHA